MTLSVPREESEQPCICVRGIIVSLSLIFRLGLFRQCRIFFRFSFYYEQIYHVCEGYLRKIPVERPNISRADQYLINHVTLRIKVKKKYSECIWRLEAREGKKKVKCVFANTTAQREKC